MGEGKLERKTKSIRSQRDPPTTTTTTTTTNPLLLLLYYKG